MYIEKQTRIAALVVVAVGLSAVVGLLIASFFSPNILDPAPNPDGVAVDGGAQSVPTVTHRSTVTSTLGASPTPSTTGAAETQPGTATSASEGTSVVTEQTYRVQVGDTLIEIADQFGVSVDAIRRRNNLTGNILRVGQELIIPSSNSNTTEIESEERVYVVQPSDTLIAIAQQFGVTVEEIRARNGLSSNSLQVGQELIIPSSTDSGTPTQAPTPLPPSPTTPPTQTPAPPPPPTQTPAPTTPPTQTPAPTTPPTQTPAPPPPPTATGAPPTAAAPTYDAPVLLAPNDGAGHTIPVTLQWGWDGELAENEHFDVRLWQEGEPHHGIAWTKATQLQLIHGDLEGTYFWSVAVIRGENGQWIADLSPEAPARRLIIIGGGSSGGGGSGPEPTPTR